MITYANEIWCDGVDVECQAKVLDCDPDEQCNVVCETANSCQDATINGPINNMFSLDCQQSSACRYVTVHAESASQFTIIDCATGFFTCTGMVIHCPQVSSGNKCILTGDSSFGSTGTDYMILYAINGWNDINITATPGSDAGGTMYCGSTFQYECEIDEAVWKCDVDGDTTCDDPPTSSPTVLPTMIPITASPTTSAPLTFAPTTSAPITTIPTTSPITSAPVTSTPITSAPLTSTPITSAPVTLAPVTSAPITAAPTSTTLDRVNTVNTANVQSTSTPITNIPTTHQPTTISPVTRIPTAATSSVTRFNTTNVVLVVDTTVASSIAITTTTTTTTKGNTISETLINTIKTTTKKGDNDGLQLMNIDSNVMYIIIGLIVAWVIIMILLVLICYKKCKDRKIKNESQLNNFKGATIQMNQKLTSVSIDNNHHNTCMHQHVKTNSNKLKITAGSDGYQIDIDNMLQNNSESDSESLYKNKGAITTVNGDNDTEGTDTDTTTPDIDDQITPNALMDNVNHLSQNDDINTNDFTKQKTSSGISIEDDADV